MIPQVGTSRARLDQADHEVGAGGDKKGMMGEKLVPKNPDQAHEGRVEQIGGRQEGKERFLVLKGR